jgi:hypothetical protein
MMIETVLLADAAAAAEKKLNVLGAGVTRLTPRVLPWAQPSLAIVIRARVEPEDLGVDHVLTVDFRGPDERSLLPAVMVAPVDQAALAETTAHSLPGELSALHVILGVQGLRVTNEGLHAIVVFLDGVEAWRYPLAVALVDNLP